MRILVSQVDNAILQVEDTPAVGISVPINGKYVIDVPEGSQVEVDPTSYVLNGLGNVDSGSVVDLAMQNLLELYPGSDFLRYNVLITGTHSGELDATATWSDGTNSFSPRFQNGRTVAPAGCAPNSVAMLPANPTTTPPRPGLIITDTIDISPEIPAGTGNFRVWWKFYEFETSEDVLAEYSPGSGTNSPAIRTIVETEAPNVTVYLSNDDGGSWVPVEKLDPVSFCDAGTEVRIAFVNSGDTKIYLAGYAILF